MMTRFAAAVLTLTLTTGVVFAAPPASKDACLEQSFSLAEKAASKKFDTEKQTKIEGMLTALETKCAADDLAGAEGDIKAVEAEIGG